MKETLSTGIEIIKDKHGNIKNMYYTHNYPLCNGTILRYEVDKLLIVANSCV